MRQNVCSVLMWMQELRQVLASGTGVSAATRGLVEACAREILQRSDQSVSSQLAQRIKDVRDLAQRKAAKHQLEASCLYRVRNSHYLLDSNYTSFVTMQILSGRLATPASMTADMRCRLTWRAFSKYRAAWLPMKQRFVTLSYRLSKAWPSAHRIRERRPQQRCLQCRRLHPLRLFLCKALSLQCKGLSLQCKRLDLRSFPTHHRLR